MRRREFIASVGGVAVTWPLALRVHCRHHLVTRDVIGPVGHSVPRSLRSVRLISVDLGIDDHHRESCSIASKFRVATRDARVRKSLKGTTPVPRPAITARRYNAIVNRSSGALQSDSLHEPRAEGARR
jgi:hypothetical protein